MVMVTLGEKVKCFIDSRSPTFSGNAGHNEKKRKRCWVDLYLREYVDVNGCKKNSLFTTIQIREYIDVLADKSKTCMLEQH